MYVDVNTEEFELVVLDIKVVFELPFFCEEIGLVLVIEAHHALGQGLGIVVLQPVSIPSASSALSLHLHDSASPQQIKSLREPLKVTEVPDSGDGEGETAIEAKAEPVPDHVEWIEDVVEHAEGDE